MKLKISVIVPVYNVAPFLEKCIDSILKQSYDNLEIILVDDGSTDESSRICDKYKFDSRVVVIHQQNGHITKARKAGLKKATGDFVTFVDGDDWVEPNMYESMINAMTENVDIVMSGMFRDNDEGTYAKWDATKYSPGVYEGDELSELQRNTLQNINGSLCNKIIKTELLKGEISYVDDELYGIQDDIVTDLCILKAKKIVVMDEAFYHGYDRLGSATHSKQKNYYIMMHRAIPAYKRMLDIYKDDYFEKKCKSYYSTWILNGVSEVFEGYHLIKYYLPLDAIKKMNNTVILYGGGDVGESYYRQLKLLDGVDIIWVDEHRDASLYSQIQLQRIREIEIGKDDFVIIAMVRRGNNIDDIIRYLNSIGIEKSQIFWKEPIRVTDL